MSGDDERLDPQSLETLEEHLLNLATGLKTAHGEQEMVVEISVLEDHTLLSELQVRQSMPRLGEEAKVVVHHICTC